MSLSNETILNVLKDRFQAHILHHEESYGMLTVQVDRAQYHDVIRFLKEDDTMAMRFLTDLCGVHYPFQKDHEFGVVVHLHNMPANKRVRIKAFMPSGDPSIASITDLFLGANWMERETFDFYGIKFKGHPDLRRILNMDEMDYHPMRKEYHLEDETREDKDDRYFGR